jgi:hypothetical protein
MTDQGTPNIDPRFDPAFQRGFDGSVTVTRRRAAPGTPSVTPAQDRSAQQAPVQRPNLPARPPVSPPEVAAAVETEPEADVVEEEVVVTRGANPFVIALWVIAAVLVAVGAWGIEWARAAFLTESLTTNVDYVLVEIVRVAAPASIGLGVATAIGLLFLSAVRWQRKRS